MPSSTSDSERSPGYLYRALSIMALMIALPLIAGRIVGSLYKPQPLAVTPTEVAATDRFVATFGNSRFEAALDGALLLGEVGDGVQVVGGRSFIGGGWDTIHYYQLALLNAERLRAGKDLVLLEVSPLSADDSDPGNRLSVIRPEVAGAVRALPGLGTEPSLDLAVGAFSGGYRYRSQIQSRLIAPRLERLAIALTRPLTGPPRGIPAFELITDPEKNFVVREIRGDLRALRVAMRARNNRGLGHLSVGGARLEALRRTVRLLRQRGISVFLVRVPLERELDERIRASAGGQRFDGAIQDLVMETGAVLLDRWDDKYYAEEMFFDDIHLMSAAAKPFTHEVAARIRNALPAR